MISSFLNEATFTGSGDVGLFAEEGITLQPTTVPLILVMLVRNCSLSRKILQVSIPVSPSV